MSRDYSLRSESEIMSYLNDTLQDVCYMVGRARQDSALFASRAIYSNLDDTNSISEETGTDYVELDTTLSRVVSNIQTAKYELRTTHANTQRIERALRIRVDALETASVDAALRLMYQALETLTPLLYDREEQESSPIYHTLEDAVATLATAINILQVATTNWRLLPNHTS